MNKINQRLIICGAVLFIAITGFYLNAKRAEQPRPHNEHGGGSVPAAKEQSDRQSPKDFSKDARGENHFKRRIPAYFSIAPKKESLPQVLNPELFSGRAREAYRAVSEIPATIAQIPCFCYCDESFKHRSLHSCFEDEHGSRCQICIEEALTAYRLEKEEKLNPEQIRNLIVARYGG